MRWLYMRDVLRGHSTFLQEAAEMAKVAAPSKQAKITKHRASLHTHQWTYARLCVPCVACVLLQEAAAKAKAAAPSKQAKGKKGEAAAPARPSTAEQ
eukprot:scaffold44928_cov23-Tisochrysis_lutea.AAC.1